MGDTTLCSQKGNRTNLANKANLVGAAPIKAKGTAGTHVPTKPNWLTRKI